ncbi:hypothetical protein TNCV_4713151 [Trichonephila clavipes]|nr:hypothetical protein TNCV_4713151 [Trichonephila clavipes]
MDALGHQSLPPTNLGRVEEEMASPSGRLPQGLQGHLHISSLNQFWTVFILLILKPINRGPKLLDIDERIHVKSVEAEIPHAVVSQESGVPDEMTSSRHLILIQNYSQSVYNSRM